MKVIFSKLAELEFEDAMRFYDLGFEGLGVKFREEVRLAAMRI